MTTLRQVDREDEQSWLDRAREINPGELPEFIRELQEDYQHMLTSVSVAMGAIAIATLNSFKQTGQFASMSNYQSEDSLWYIIKYFRSSDLLYLMDFKAMAYPQYANRFKMPKNYWLELRRIALENLKGDRGSESVREHWQSIADGNVPFGYKVAE